MGMQPEHEDWLSKLIVYVVGTLIGITSRLVTLNRDEKLTKKEGIFQSVIAMACSWIVWWSLHDRIPTGMAAACSVVVGRFGDTILMAIGKALRSWILSQSKPD